MARPWQSYLGGSGVFASALLGILAACGDKPEAVPERPAQALSSTPTAAETTTAGVAAERPAPSATPTATAKVSLPKPAIPMLTPNEVKITGKSNDRVFPIHGAQILVRGDRIGRVVSDGVLWIGKIPGGGNDSPGTPASIVNVVKGEFPDRVDVIYTATPGRVGVASYLPLTGKGNEHSLSPGSGLIEDVVTVGESTVLVTSSTGRRDLFTARGPEISLGEAPAADPAAKDAAPATLPEGILQAVGGTKKGTLVAVGPFGKDEAIAAWIWSGPGKARLIELGQWLKKEGDPYRHRQFWNGTDDELWLYTDTAHPILHYKDGAFEEVPALGKPMQAAFASDSGQLHASDGRVIFRLEGGQWKAVAEMPWSIELQNPANHKGVYWSGVLSLRENGGMEARDDCTTPFLALHDVAENAAADSTFPEDRKALASFPGASDITLVEHVPPGGRKQVGILVKDNASGLALLTHLAESMKDTPPRLLCFAPSNARTIPLKPASP